VFAVLIVGHFFLSPDDAFCCSHLALGPFFGPWCLSVDTVYVGLPLYIDFRGLFPLLWSSFADFVYVGLPLYINFRGLFTWLWSRFADPVYVGSPLDIDLFTRL
jgi:hypothetical protein